jgi:anaerobic selenocysteine-containing dehydrogenase
MQALTGLFARQFGTPNYAAHGGFCSVNMAAGMIYTIGGSFWEFGGPDLERAKLFVMIGTAEDHHSNPLKIALSKFKRQGGRFIAINPVRTGYSAIADEWVPIKPGTDGALLLALVHEVMALGLYDRDFLARYTNAGQLVNQDPDSDEFGLMMRNPEGDIVNPLRPHNFYWWDRHTGQPVADHTEGTDPSLLGRFTMPDGPQQGTPAAPSFQLLEERVRDYTPEWAAASPASRRRPSAAWRTRWASPRATRRSSCPSPGPTAGAAGTRASPATRWPSTPCAGWPRTATASRPSARWRS